MIRKLSTALLILAGFAGAGLGAWIYQQWKALSAASDHLEAVSELYPRHLVILAGIVAIWLLGYLLSFDYRLPKRPTILVLLTAFFAAAPGGMIGREALSALEIFIDPIPVPDLPMVGMIIGAGGMLCLLVVLFESVNSIVWTSLANSFDQKDMGSLALFSSRLALMFRPGQSAMLRSVALARFRRGARGDVVEVLLQLHRDKKADPDVLEALCKHASEQGDKVAYLGYLKELHAMLPDEGEIAEALIEELRDQGKHGEALALIEARGVANDPDALERYANILFAEGQAEKTAEVAIKLGQVEGIPFRRSQKLLREVLARTSEYVPALNALAAQADRMALRDQKIRWLEKSFEADPRQDEVRDALIRIYRELDNSVRLEDLLRFVVERNPKDGATLFEYIEVMYQNEKVDEALARLEALNATEEAPARALLLEAQIRLERREWEAAAAIAERALYHEPSDEDRTRAATLISRVEKAVLTEEVAEVVEQAREKPDDVELQLLALNRLINGGHADKVVGLCDEFLHRHPTQLPRVIEALREFARRPEVPFSILNLLTDHTAVTGKYDETLEAILLMEARSVDPVATVREATQKILRRAPHHLATLRYLGDTYLKHGRFTDMIHSYSLYLSNGGQNTEEINRSMATAYVALKDYRNAKKFVDSLLASGSQKSELLKNIIPVAIDADEAEDAAEYFKQLELFDPRDPAVKVLRAKVELAVGQRRFSFLQREVEAGRGGSELLEQLGDIARGMERYSDAITYFQRASRDREDTILARRCTAKLAWCYMKKRLDDLCQDALRDITITLEDDPQELQTIMDILYEIGDMFVAYRMFDRAERVFKQLCKIDAGYRDVLGRVESLRK